MLSCSLCIFPDFAPEAEVPVLVQKLVDTRLTLTSDEVQWET